MKRINKIAFLSAILLFSISLLYVSSCKKESNNEETPVEGTATINGTVRTPSGKAVGNALISVNNASTHSNYKGEFSLLIPSGNQTVIILTGNGRLFKKQIPVDLENGQVYKIPDNQTVLSQTGNLAFIPGSYDHIETIIIDTLGYTASPITVNDLQSMSVLANYEALFFNCTDLSSAFMLDSLAYANLSAFIAGGGSIYASDFAVEYLTGNGFYRLASSSQNNYTFSHRPMRIQSTCVSPKIGGFIPDSSLCTLKSGMTGLVPSVKVLDPGMITALGKDSLDILYDLANWEVVSLDDAPFSRIMEKTNGYPMGAVALRSNFSAPSGNIYFTTFHNHPQSFVSHDVMVVLQYFIMNL